MTMYKIIGENNDVIRTVNSDGSITCFQEESPGYDKFIQDVAEQGYDIVEGPDVVQPSYADLRRPEYPPIEDQLDKIYHSGVAAWKKDIKKIKDKYPKHMTEGSRIGEIPDWVKEAVEEYLNNQ